MRKLEASIGNVYRPLDAPAAWMDSLAVMSVNVIQEQLTVSDDDGGFPLKYVESRLPYYETWHGDVRIWF